MAEYLQLIYGLDVTGDPKLAYSRVFAGAVLAKCFIAMFDMIKQARKIEYGAGDWNNLFFFVTFMSMAFAVYVIATIIAVGNARKPEQFLKFRCVFTIVASIGITVGATVLRLHDFEDAGTLNKTLGIGCTIIEAILQVILIAVMCARLMDKDTHNQIVLQADTQGRWGADDLRGFEKAAGVETSYYAEGNVKSLVGPNMIREIKGLLFPQPFTDTNHFPSTSKYEQIAKDARLVYPIRLWVAMFLTASFILTVYIGGLAIMIPKVGKSEEYIGDINPLMDDEATRNADKALLAQLRLQLQNMTAPTAASSGAQGKTTTKQEVVALLTWASQNPAALNQCLADNLAGIGCSMLDSTSNSIGTWLENEVTRIFNYYAVYAQEQIVAAYIKEDESYTEWWIDEGNKMCVITIILFTITTGLALWFVWVGKLAYRKKVLELSLSSVRYFFDPVVMNGCRDTKFVASFFCSILLGWFLFTFIVMIIGFIISLEEVWKFLFVDNIGGLIAFAIYQATTILVVPKIHAKLVLKDGLLVKPRLQSSIIFVWELFYFPQTAFGVFLKAIFCLIFSAVNFLRPDAPLLPHGFTWLDGFHSAYVSTVYAQMEGAMRRFGDSAPEAWTDKVANVSEHAYSEASSNAMKET